MNVQLLLNIKEALTYIDSLDVTIRTKANSLLTEQFPQEPQFIVCLLLICDDKEVPFNSNRRCR